MCVSVPIFLRARVCLPEYTAVFWAMVFLVAAIACGFFVVLKWAMCSAEMPVLWAGL